MQATPDKFQAISVGKKTYAERKSIKVSNANITCEESLKLLRVELDYKLDFDNQIIKMCETAAKQLNVLQRLS